jgi:hypothetical protein
MIDFEDMIWTNIFPKELSRTCNCDLAIGGELLIQMALDTPSGDDAYVYELSSNYHEHFNGHARSSKYLFNLELISTLK